MTTTDTTTAAFERADAPQIPGPRSVELDSRRERAVPPGVGVSFHIGIARHEGAQLFDVDGNRFVDFTSGIGVTSLGGNHPALRARVDAQLDRVWHTCFAATEYEPYIELSERLNALVPGERPNRTMLASTGAEAVENAVKIARHYTGRPLVAAFSHAFHGRTLMAMALTDKVKPYKLGFGPFPDAIVRLPLADAREQLLAPATVPEQLDAIAATIDAAGADQIALLIIEPVQGEGGINVPPPGLIAGIAAIARERGIVFAADEIQTGMGRTGSMFAIAQEGTYGDLTLTAKALGNGLPIAAVTGRADIMDAVHVGGLGGTYAGNPVACAAALGVLDAIEDEDLIVRARIIGEIALAQLRDLQQQVPRIIDVRGRGAMLAVEFGDPDTFEPDAAFTAAVVRRCYERGVAVLSAGTHGNALRLLPPLIISDDELDEGLAAIIASVHDIAAARAIAPGSAEEARS